MSKALAIAERVDISSLSFDLPKRMASLEGFRFFEQQLDIASGDIQDAETRFAYHLYMILEHQLYLQLVNEAEEVVRVVDRSATLSNLPIRGTVSLESEEAEEMAVSLEYSLRNNILRFHHSPPDGLELTVRYSYNEYPFQKDYLDYLDQSLGKSVSTMKRNFGAMRMATNPNNALGVASPGDVGSRGIALLAAVSERFRTDPETGEIFDIKKGELPDGYSAKEYAREVIDRLVEANGQLSKKDLYIEKERLLAPSVPRVWFTVESSGLRLWHWELYKLDKLSLARGEIAFEQNVETGELVIRIKADEHSGEVPDEVLDYLVLKFAR